jgi:hypothetical protein
MRLHNLSGARSHGPRRGRPNNDRAPMSSQLNDRVPVNPDHFQQGAVKNQADAIADMRQLLKQRHTKLPKLMCELQDTNIVITVNGGQQEVNRRLRREHPPTPALRPSTPWRPRTSRRRAPPSAANQATWRNRGASYRWTERGATSTSRKVDKRRAARDAPRGARAIEFPPAGRARRSRAAGRARATRGARTSDTTRGRLRHA